MMEFGGWTVQSGLRHELWLQLLLGQLLRLLVLLEILIAPPWVMGIGVGVRWKRSPNHRRPQTMTMHPCPAVRVLAAHAGPGV